MLNDVVNTADTKEEQMRNRFVFVRDAGIDKHEIKPWRESDGNHYHQRRYKDASLLQAKLLKRCTLKIYPGFSHGMMTVNADAINADLLAFIRS